MSTVREYILCAYRCVSDILIKKAFFSSTPGYLFGKRVLFFLLLMCVIGIFNYLLLRFYGGDYKEHVETITSAASALLLIP